MKGNAILIIVFIVGGILWLQFGGNGAVVKERLKNESYSGVVELLFRDEDNHYTSTMMVNGRKHAILDRYLKDTILVGDYVYKEKGTCEVHLVKGADTISFIGY